MINQQQLQQPYHHSPHILSFSNASSSKISSITSSSPMIAHSLPPISPPLLSRYRNQRLPQNLFTSNKPFTINSILTSIFCGKESDASISMCDKCDRAKDYDLCTFMLQLVEEKYDWREDVKFRTSYEFYHKKKIQVFLTDKQIQHRLVSKFNTLGVVLLQNHKLLLTRILKTYFKHTIYYNQHTCLTTQTDYPFWFLAGIYYHIGVPNYFSSLESLPKDTVGIHEPMMFWMLDTVMKRLKDCTQQKLRHVAQMTVQYCQFFYQRETRCIDFYGISLTEIMLQWTNQAMMGYMGIEFIGFFIKSILKQGYEYIQKTMMSYFEKRVVKMDRDEVVNFHHFASGNQSQNSGILKITEQQRKNKKEQILKLLLDSNEEWPGIFFSTNVYDLKK